MGSRNSPKWWGTACGSWTVPDPSAMRTGRSGWTTPAPVRRAARLGKGLAGNTRSIRDGLAEHTKADATVQREILDRLQFTEGSQWQPPPEAALPRLAEQAISALLERAGGLGDNPSRVRLSLLHLMPRRETGAHLSAQPSLSTLSAGAGPGPWNIRLDTGVDELGDRKFDVVFIEDDEAWVRLPGAEERITRMVDRIQPGGFISSLDPAILEPLQRDRRLAEVSRMPSIYRRTVEHIELLLDPASVKP